MKNIRKGQNRIGDNRKMKEKDKLWRQMKRKKKSSKKTQG